MTPPNTRGRPGRTMATRTRNRQYSLRLKGKAKNNKHPKKKKQSKTRHRTTRPTPDTSSNSNLNKTSSPGVANAKIQAAAEPNFGRHRDADHDRINNHFDGELTTVPNPVPDTGYGPTQASDVSSPEISATASADLLVFPSSFKTHESAPALSSLSYIGSPTDALPTAKPMPSTEPLQPNSSGLGPLNETLNAAASTSYSPSKVQGLSVSMIILISVISATALVSGCIFFVFRYCYRSKRRPRPKPSLPILDDSFADDKSDSPIFGGKERLSSRPGGSGLWAWTQYRTISEKPQTSSTSNVPSSPKDHFINSNMYGAVARSPRLHPASPLPKSAHRFTHHSHTRSAPVQATEVPSPYQPSMQQVRSALSRATGRISAASMSLYPSTPQLSMRNSEVGIAIGSASPATVYTADGHDVLKRMDSRRSLDRHRGTASPESGAKAKRHSQGQTNIAYGGVEPGSPTALPYVASNTSLQTTGSARGGRTRIKSSYYTQARASHLPSSSSTLSRTGADPPSIPPLKGTNASETQSQVALAYALGLTSPTSAPYTQLGTSSSASSLSGKASRKPVLGLDRDEMPVIKTAVGATAALGSLVDFSALNKTNVVTKTNNPTSAPSRRLSAATNKPPTIHIRPPSKDLKEITKRTNDKPPYIPLPAPLPSLAQMAMEHTNPSCYADYRSPTYSIYGLYECERKSGNQ